MVGQVELFYFFMKIELKKKIPEDKDHQKEATDQYGSVRDDLPDPSVHADIPGD